MRVAPIFPIYRTARFPARRPSHSPNLKKGLQMKMHKSITTDRIMEACESGDSMGFCIACGADAYGVEPDACGYTCEECDADAVYGAEELLLMTVA
jgi:hypothetical protein